MTMTTNETQQWMEALEPVANPAGWEVEGGYGTVYCQACWQSGYAAPGSMGWPMGEADMRHGDRCQECRQTWLDLDGGRWEPARVPASMMAREAGR